MTLDLSDNEKPRGRNLRICRLMKNNNDKCKDLLTYFKEELKLSREDLKEAIDVVQGCYAGV